MSADHSTPRAPRRPRRTVEFEGRTLTVAAWAEETGVPNSVILHRLNDGWTVARTLTTPHMPKVETAVERRCHDCDEVKPLSQFGAKFPNRRSTYHPVCLACRRVRLWRRRMELKAEVIRLYSGGSMKCELCTESRIEVLDIDHRHGDGSEHRRNGGSSGSLYSDYLKQADTARYRVLCRNCNWIEHLRLHGQGRYSRHAGADR